LSHFVTVQPLASYYKHQAMHNRFAIAWCISATTLFYGLFIQEYHRHSCCGVRVSSADKLRIRTPAILPEAYLNRRLYSHWDKIVFYSPLTEVGVFSNWDKCKVL